MRSFLFPPGFLWGSATSAWQVEGGSVPNEYRQMHREGRIAGGADPAEAAGFWERYPEDIALLRQMRHGSFRLSLEWARIEPEEGRFNFKALRHYRLILLALLQAGIQPVVDLHHHSSPLWLYRYGGWTSMKAAGFLARFAETASGALGDLVRVWMTVNEPTMWAVGAYLTREYPPYRRSLRLFLRCLEVFAAAHVALYQRLNEVHARNNWPRPTIGFAHAVHGIDPFDRRSPPDRLAARLVRRLLEERFLDRVLAHGPTIDALGLNYYLCLLARFPLAYRLRTDLPLSKEGWPIDPPGFRRVLREAWERYRIPIWVLENGVGEDDDELRPRFLLDHLYQMHRAIADGVQVRAYHHWSAMDTLEYQKGYAIRYGLIGVDFASEGKTRSLRASGRMYGEIAGANGITEEIVRKYVPDWSPDAFPQGYPRLYGPVKQV